MKNKERKKKTKFTVRTWVILFTCLLVPLYGVIYVVPKVSDIFVQTYHAKYGTLDSSFEVQCVFVRDEEVYKSDGGGNVERYVEEGRLVRQGSHILDVGGINYYNGTRGVVSYSYDGYESRLTSADMAQMTKEFLESYKSEEHSVKTMSSDNVEAGQPVFKIVNNKEWFLVCWIGKKEAETIEAGQALKVKLDEKNILEMTAHTITQQGAEYQLILSCNRTYTDFDKYRVKKCSIITSSDSGIILETDSIVEEEGTKGVYVINKLGQANFVPISIVASHGDKTVVAKNYFYDEEGYSVATVKNYDEVLREVK